MTRSEYTKIINHYAQLLGKANKLTEKRKRQLLCWYNNLS
jgi:hypothetical protein